MGSCTVLAKTSAVSVSSGSKLMKSRILRKGQVINRKGAMMTRFKKLNIFRIISSGVTEQGYLDQELECHRSALTHKCVLILDYVNLNLIQLNHPTRY